MRSTLLCILTGMLLLIFASTVFAEGPAVSRINGKIEGLGGEVDNDSFSAAAGSLTVPLGERFGLQADVAYGEIDDNDVNGAGVHLFTRDPEKYLLGFNGVYAQVEDIDLERYALEGEYYIGSFTLAGMVGQQGGDVDDATFGSADIRWYPIDNLMLEVGGSTSDEDDSNMCHIGAEYQVVRGLSVFAEAATGENDYDHAFAGARYYFGEDKSLVKRHREDDPQNNVLSTAIESLAGVLAVQDSCPVAATSDNYDFPRACSAKPFVDCNGVIRDFVIGSGSVTETNIDMFDQYIGQPLDDFRNIGGGTGCI